VSHDAKTWALVKNRGRYRVMVIGLKSRAIQLHYAPHP